MPISHLHSNRWIEVVVVKAAMSKEVDVGKYQTTVALFFENLRQCSARTKSVLA
jgi:hypothetical protein